MAVVGQEIRPTCTGFEHADPEHQQESTRSRNAWTIRRRAISLRVFSGMPRNPGRGRTLPICLLLSGGKQRGPILDHRLTGLRLTFDRQLHEEPLAVAGYCMVLDFDTEAPQARLEE